MIAIRVAPVKQEIRLQYTDSLTDVNILNNRKLDLNTITRTIRDAASRLKQRPTSWIPTHTGIPGNENADQAIKRGLQLDRIHTTVNAITFTEQTRMKEQMARRYNEQTYNDASKQTKDHRQLHQRKLMSVPRKVQRSIWRLNMRCPTYSQVRTGQPVRCRWCDEDYNSITEHWLRHCPAMVYWQKLMTV